MLGESRGLEGEIKLFQGAQQVGRLVLAVQSSLSIVQTSGTELDDKIFERSNAAIDDVATHQEELNNYPGQELVKLQSKCITSQLI